MNENINCKGHQFLGDGRIFENGIEGKWLTTKQAAKFLGLTENALRILVCRQKVRAYKLGRRLRFKEFDLNQLLSLKRS